MSLRRPPAWNRGRRFSLGPAALLGLVIAPGETVTLDPLPTLGLAATSDPMSQNRGVCATAGGPFRPTTS